jgi:cytochrome c553
MARIGDSRGRCNWLKQAFLYPALLTACHVCGPGLARGADVPEPLWAYGFLKPPGAGDRQRSQTPPPTSRNLSKTESIEEQTRLRKVDGSLAAYSRVDIRDGGNVIDWFPGDHPPMTGVMAHGPASLGKASWGCAYCHLPNGKGRPENAPVAGQSVGYILRQLDDFRDDLRASADPRKPNTPIMAGLAKTMSQAEMSEAAAYFAAAKWTAWTRVVETDLVPKTRVEGNLFRATAPERTEPIEGRIIEVPENEEQSEVLRNPRSGFIAYVPVGSIKKGESLVNTGGVTVEEGKIVPGRTLACTVCHGPDLMGLADIPGIAGRSPSYLVRQIYDFQKGTRKGKSAVLMQPVVANLSSDDMVAIAAYISSRGPRAAN